MINSEIYTEVEEGLGQAGFAVKIFVGPIETKLAKNDETIREQLATKIAERAFEATMSYLESLLP